MLTRRRGAWGRNEGGHAIIADFARYPIHPAADIPERMSISGVSQAVSHRTRRHRAHARDAESARVLEDGQHHFRRQPRRRICRRLKDAVLALGLRPLRCGVQHLLEDLKQRGCACTDGGTSARGGVLQPLHQFAKSRRVAQGFEDRCQRALPERPGPVLEAEIDDLVPLHGFAGAAFAENVGVIDLKNLEVSAARGSPCLGDAAVRNQFLGRAHEQQQQGVSVEGIGAPLDAQRRDQAVVHEPGELADGLVGACRYLSVNDQGVWVHGERDVACRSQAARRRGDARQGGLNRRVSRRIERHRPCSGPARPREFREHCGLLGGHRAGGRRLGHRNVIILGAPP